MSDLPLSSVENTVESTSNLMERKMISSGKLVNILNESWMGMNIMNFLCGNGRNFFVKIIAFSPRKLLNTEHFSLKVVHLADFRNLLANFVDFPNPMENFAGFPASNDKFCKKKTPRKTYNLPQKHSTFRLFSWISI